MFPNPLDTARSVSPVEAALQRVLSIDRLHRIYDDVLRTDDGRPYFERLLAYLKVNPLVAQADLARIPSQGPVIVVANHPFGLIEGALLAAVLPAIRPDVRIMANSLLSAMPALADRFIFVDPFGGERAMRANHQGLKDAISWLRHDGMLAVFPAGEVAHLDLRRGGITDPPWSPTIARIARITNASVAPVFFQGANGWPFQILGLLHPLLRTALLPLEFLNKQETDIELRIGNPIPPRKLRDFNGDEELIEYLRRRTYLLENRTTPKQKRSSSAPSKSIIHPVPAVAMEKEIESLDPACRLAESSDLGAWLSHSGDIPQVLREIGRLREVTFRQTGEGTGNAIDLDSFDDHYLHLFLWNQKAREVVGAYRLGPTDTILERFGKRGLYTSTLFAYRTAFLHKLGPALEMGRSFVRAEYQRSYAPLLLLWKGIGAYLAANPRYRKVFGPVSISNEYHPNSRQLMVAFFKATSSAPDLAGLVRARSPFRARLFAGCDGMDLEELEAMIADIETVQKGVPILLKQYLKLGGKLLTFNVDVKFADTLDGLILVDLDKTDPRLLERYLGRHGLAMFKAHGAMATSVQ